MRLIKWFGKEMAWASFWSLMVVIITALFFLFLELAPFEQFFLGGFIVLLAGAFVYEKL